MRKIKFRAWDKKEKIMINSESKETSETYSDGISMEGNFSFVQCNACRDGEDFILMQFTGLKDKDGKEIFEGDIVKYPHGIGKVIFMNCSYWIDTKYCCVLLYDYTIEILGNIYENPELLSKSTRKKNR